VKGIVNVIDACRQNNIRNLVLASSAEVYQTASRVPTDESVPLIVPDPHNPRYSYGGGKIISELMAINYGRKYFDRVLIFRPHNIYGPDMGFEHVIPQFTLRLKKEARQQGNGVVRFQIQGSGRETRSFCHISDLVQGVMVMRSRGEHLGIYHIGTSEEVAIGDLANRIAGTMSLEIELISTSTLAGSTPRRCPDISKLVGLGYQPRVRLNEGLPPTVRWYCENEQLAGQLQART
jgi:nucleoside-diphosphate-sugar epimerase